MLSVPVKYIISLIFTGAISLSHFSRIIKSIFLCLSLISFNLLSVELNHSKAKRRVDTCHSILTLLFDKLSLIDTERVPVGGSSFGSKVKGFEKKIVELEKLVPRIPLYVELYTKMYKKIPTNRDILIYQLESNIQLVDKLLEFKIDFDARLNFIVDEVISEISFSNRVRGGLESLIRSRNSFLDSPYDSKNSKFTEMVNLYSRSYEGPIGEFDILMRLNDYYAHSVMIGTEVSQKRHLASNYERIEI